MPPLGLKAIGALLLVVVCMCTSGANAQVATSPDIQAVFNETAMMQRFRDTQTITVLRENATELTLVFHFAGANATVDYQRVDDLSRIERLDTYGIVSWGPPPATTTTTVASTTTTMAPVPPGPQTFAPVDPAAPHILYRMFFTDGGPLSESATVAALASVAETDASRFTVSAVWWVPTEIENKTSGGTSSVMRRLIEFRVKNPPAGRPEGASTTTGLYATVLLINTRLLERQGVLFQTLAALVDFTATANAPPYSLADAAAEGGKMYSDEKLRFMGALIATLVILSALLLAGWMRTQQLVGADLEKRAAQAQLETVQRLMDGPSSPSSMNASPGGKAASPSAGSAASPTRPKRSVSFHHSAVPATGSATTPPGSGRGPKEL